MKEIFDKVLQADPNVPVAEVLANVTIMFADEDHETLGLMRTVVNKLGWKGLFVHSALEMIETVNEILVTGSPLDAVVAEVNYLSGSSLTGITAAREIRKAKPNVPILFLSSYVTTSLVREEIRRVDAQYISKPFDVEDLFIRLSKLIYWHRLTMGQGYTGEDRRHNSVNRTGAFRRASDYILSTPTRIRQTLLGDKL
jgi:CheY-like chemotaxis protein